MTPAETQRSPVKDIEKAEQTQEREVYEEPNFRGRAIKGLTDALNDWWRLSGRGSRKEKTNYLDLYKTAQAFRDEAMAKGLKADSAEFIELQNKYQQKAAAFDWDYEPAKIEDVFKQVYGDKLMKPVEQLIEEGAKQRISMDEEARLIGARVAPNKPAIEQASLGRSLYMSSKVSDELMNELLPNMSAKEREEALTLNYRDAMQMVTLMSFDQFLNASGGIANPTLLQAFKTDWTARLRMAGFPGAAAQKFVDNTMAIWEGAINTAGNDKEAQAKYTKNVKDAWENMSYMKMAATPIQLKTKGSDGKSKVVTTNLGTIYASVGGNFSGTAGQQFLGDHPEVMEQIATNPDLMNFAELSDDTQNIVLTVGGNAKLKDAFVKGSVGSKNIDKLAQKGAQMYYEAEKSMTRDEMKQNAAVNTAVNAYVGSHANVDTKGFTDLDNQIQGMEFAQAADASGQGYNKFLQGIGAVLIDKEGNPHYIVAYDGKIRDSSRDGSLVEWLDNDSVDARNYVFPAARQAVATAADLIGWNDAIDIWNLKQIQTSQAFAKLPRNKVTNEYMDGSVPLTMAQARKALDAFYDKQYDKRLNIYEDISGGEEARIGPLEEVKTEGMYDPNYRIQTPVSNATVAAIDNRTGGIVFNTTAGRNVTSPVDGQVTDISKKDGIGNNSITITTSDGEVWTITGTKMNTDKVKVGDTIEKKQIIGKTGGKAVGITIRDLDGMMIDPRKKYYVLEGKTKEEYDEELEERDDSGTAEWQEMSYAEQQAEMMRGYEQPTKVATPPTPVRKPSEVEVEELSDDVLQMSFPNAAARTRELFTRRR